MRNIYSVLIILIFAVGCSSSKEVVSPEQQKKVEDLIHSKSFIITSSWAMPQVTNSLMALQNSGIFPLNSSVSMIDISSTSNSFIIKKDSISADLPYFGERQMGASGYTNRDSGIAISGIPKNYKVTKTKKGNHRIKFSVSDRNDVTENYTVNVLVFNNLSTQINITSSHRFGIGFRGTLKPLKTEI
ncbi:DUF4251 domain-containing protein [Tenacibaculum agarivorans]|uniref:DUF4251 domain-containing protein n=1 Tax=Tenacibaculum agarivorans TaxID=1908389 RepID=UPI00094B8296|nr:DUF4251 domain-containing protein [Tenacibaculum agarivorans]